MSLDSFFNPSSIAVVGVSNDPSKLGAVVFNNVIDAGYEGKLYAINPKCAGQELYGKPCYASVADLPEAIDLVVRYSGQVYALPFSQYIPIKHFSQENSGIGFEINVG